MTMDATVPPHRSEQERNEQAAIATAFECGEMRNLMMPAKRISTPLSHVFLSNTRAFKLKRAVRLPFVDLSGIEQRRAGCEAELVHNDPMAGSLYEGVLPITRGCNRRYGIDGPGEIVDWVVVMHRFDSARQFDRLAERRALHPTLVERLVERIARFHASRPTPADRGQVGEYRALIDNLSRAESKLPRHGGARLGESLTKRLQAELSDVALSLERRRGQGRVRRGHGDLRLRNICMFNGTPTAFGALEFDERLAVADVLYDLAYLLMDLRRAGLIGCAEAATRRYGQTVGEEAATATLLPFFMATRAAVRMAAAAEIGDLADARAYRKLGLEMLEISVDRAGGDARAYA